MNGIDAALQTLLASNPVTDITEKGFEIFCQAPPHVFTICLSDVITHDQIFQAFPLHICIP